MMAHSQPAEKKTYLLIITDCLQTCIDLEKAQLSSGCCIVSAGGAEEGEEQWKPITIM